MKKFLTPRKMSLVIILLGWLTAILITNLTAQADEGSLRSDISGLQSRITRLESEIGYLRQSIRPNTGSPPTAPRYQPPASEQNSVLSQDPMFKQFAKLLVELQEDVKDLENRVNKLEKHLKPSK